MTRCCRNGVSMPFLEVIDRPIVTRAISLISSNFFQFVSSSGYGPGCNYENLTMAAIVQGHRNKKAVDTYLNKFNSRVAYKN